MCPIVALWKHLQIITDSPPNFTVGGSPAHCLTVRWPDVGQCWKLDSSEKIILLQSFTVLSLVLICFSLIKGFFQFCMTSALSLGACSELSSLCTSPYHPITICYSFCRSLDVILWLLIDIWMSCRSTRSVESNFRHSAGLYLCCPHCLQLDLDILRLKATWVSLYPFSSKARMEPFFSSIKISLFSSFAMVNNYYLIPITFFCYQHFLFFSHIT